MSNTLQTDKLILGLRNRPPKTRDELNWYLRKYYGIYLASQVIEEGNSSPLDFVWDAYSTALGITKDPHYNILGLATRGGQKTLSMAVLEALLIQHDSRNLIHMAAIQAQANVGYDHFKKIWNRPLMAGVVFDPTMKETKSIKRQNTIQISVATMESVNAKHGSLLQDELDLIPKKIFDEAQGMISAEMGKMPLNICISSRKFAIGNVQRIINDTKNNPDLWKVHKWGILEFTAKCHPDRHGGGFGEEIWVDDENLMAISPKEYSLLPNDSVQKSKYEKNTGYKNCLSCGIFSFCKGRLPNQVDDNPHLQPIEATKADFKKNDPVFFLSQRLNRKPSRRGLVYPMYDELIHLKTYGEMWEIFHGEPHPDLVPDANGKRLRWDITLDELVEAFTKAGCRGVVGVDFGFSILAVAGLYFIDGSDRIFFVDEIAREAHSDAELASEIKRLWGRYSVEIVYADPESPSGKKEIRKATEWAVSEKVDKKVESGISTFRRYLRVPGTKETMFYVAPACVVFREEIPMYHYKIDPKTDEPTEIINKKNDHSLDQSRYVVHTIYGNASTNLGFTGATNGTGKPLMAANSTLTRAPTAKEMASIIGVEFNENPTLNEEVSDKDDTGGGGGFSWSF